MQNLETLEEAVNLEEEVTEQLVDTGVMQCAVDHVQRFEPPDKTLYEAPQRQHSGSVALLPPLKTFRGAPSLGPKGKILHDVDNPSVRAYTVMTDPPFFSSPSFRAPTVRFFSVYADLPSDEDKIRIGVESSVCKKSSSSSADAVVANIERTIFAPVSQGCMRQSGVNTHGQITSAEGWNLSWGGRWKDEELSRAMAFHRVNHFPGTWHLGRKDNLAAGLLRCAQRHPDAFCFSPKTYFMPYDLPILKKDLSAGGMFIAKPPASARGKGIFVFKDSIPAELAAAASAAAEQRAEKRVARVAPKPAATDESSDDDDDDDAACDDETEEFLVQRYIANPLLINGFKWDLRVYVMCTSFDPLTVYIYNDGLVRFATEPFDAKNVSKACCHLTNFSINRESGKYIKTDDPTADGCGSKWTLHALRRYFASQQWNWDQCWASVESIIVKTFISCEDLVAAKMRQIVKHHHTCFELYGFDVLIDSSFKPYLIEVNVLPSLGCGTALDKHVKGHMIADLLTAVGIPIIDRARAVESAQLAREKKAMGDASTAPGFVCNNTPMRSIKGKDALTVFAHPEAARKVLPTLDETDKALLRNCEEELRRCGGWNRAIPSPSSAADYGVLFVRRSYYNMLMWLWEAEKVRFSECERLQAIEWLRGDAPYPIPPLPEKKKKVPPPPKLPRVSTLQPRIRSVDPVALPPTSHVYNFVKVEHPEPAVPLDKAAIPIQCFSFGKIASRRV